MTDDGLIRRKRTDGHHLYMLTRFTRLLIVDALAKIAEFDDDEDGPSFSDHR